MKKFKNWISDGQGHAMWILLLLLLIPVFVEYDNNSDVLEARVGANVSVRSVVEQEEVSVGLSTRYAEAWQGWWRMDAVLARRIILAADRQKVPHHIAFGLIAVESGFDSLAVGRAGEIGLTQLKLSTARAYGGRISKEDLYQVDKNLDLGLRYFHDLLHAFNGDVYLALAAYNMGPTKVRDLKRNDRHVSMAYPNKVLGR